MQKKIESTQNSQRLWKFIHHPLIRIVIAILFLMLGVAIAQLVIGLFGTTVTTPGASIVSIAIALLATYFSYRLYVQWVERRKVTELSAGGAIKELGAGLLTGFFIVTVIIGILWALGSYQVTGFNPWLVLLPAAVANIPSGFVQEILFRGILFRITEESLGTWIALTVSTFLFGIIHVFSAHATIFSVLSIMLEAGILLTAAYILTKRLWLAVGIHIAWDFAIDGIFGVGSTAMTDKTIQGLFQAQLVGQRWLTGGDQGIEASIVGVLIAFVVGCSLIWLAVRKQRFSTILRVRRSQGDSR